MNTIVISILSIILYLLTAYRIARRLARGTAVLRDNKAGFMLPGFGAVALHAYVLYESLFVAAGINLGFFNAISLIAWWIALLVLLVAISRPVENVGIATLPLTAVAVLLALLFPSRHILVSEGIQGLEIHIMLSMLAYSMLSIAAVHAILLAIQDHHLHNRQPGGFIRALPPLRTMEILLFQMITIGFILLSFALVSGVMFLEDIFAQHLVHKTVLSIAAWVVFAILLWGRWHSGWRGRKAIRWTLGGVFALVLAYAGSKLVLELILARF